MSTRIIITSTPDNERSLIIARALTEGHLAACVSVVPGVLSIYQWEGALHEDREELLIIKTSKAVLDSALAEIKRLHPYDTPELIVVEPESVDEKYEAWLNKVTGATPNARSGRGRGQR